MTVALLALGIGLLTIWVYAPVRAFDFVNWDDLGYLTENPQVQAGLSARNLLWALTTQHAPYWHPLTWLSHMLDVSLFGMDPGPHHVTSAILHVMSSVLLFFVLRRMTKQTGASAFVAAVFAVHPVHVESVAWLAERKDVLSTFFLVATLAAYVRYVERHTAGRYAAVVALYCCALMSKPMVVTLPVALLLLDVWPLRRLNEGALTRAQTARRLLLEKLPLFALALATGVATFVVQHQVGAVAGLQALPVGARLSNALAGYVSYVWKTIWPVHLAPFYPYRELPAWHVAAAAFVLIAASTAAIRAARTRPYVFVGWLWFMFTIAPVIGLLQSGEQAMADRFNYVPMIGLLLAATWTAAEYVPPRAAWPAGVAIVLALAVTARAQVVHWSDSVTLWQHAARVTDGNYIAHENLGQALRERGQLDAARDEYLIALSMAPARAPGYEAVIHNSLGMVFMRQGRAKEAMEQFTSAVALNPTFPEAQTNLGNALAQDGRYAEASAHYREAIRLKPEYTEPRVGLGAALLSQGRAADAIPEYMEALRLDPQLAQAHNGLGGALATQGRDSEAMAQYEEALRLKPDLSTAHLNVALLLIKRGDAAAARRHLETALAIDPGYEPAQRALRAIGPKA